MDTYVLIAVILAILDMTQANNMLECLECEHIGWDYVYNFDGVQNIYGLLQNKYNPACSEDNPRDQTSYQQKMQNQANQDQNRQQQQQQQQPGNQYNNFYQQNYDVRTTICPVYANTNRCSHINGTVFVYLPSYDGEMTLHMDVRNCIDATTDLEDGCYQRDTNLGYPEVKNFLQDRLQFLGSVEVNRFIGKQCYCRTDMCYIVSAARYVIASYTSLVLAVIACIVIK